MNRKVAQLFSKESVSNQIEHLGFTLPCRAQNGALAMYAIVDGNGSVYVTTYGGLPTCELNVSNCPFKTASKYMRDTFRLSIAESKWHRVAIIKDRNTLIHIMVFDAQRNEVQLRNVIAGLEKIPLTELANNSDLYEIAAWPSIRLARTITMPTYIELECNPNTIEGAKGITKKFNVTPEALEARKIAAIKRSVTRQATEAKRKLEGRRNVVTMACKDIEA